MKNTLFTTALLLMLCISCNSISPRNYWENFDSINLKEAHSDTGPLGGMLEMYWRASAKNHFKAIDIIKYATEGGWILADRIPIAKSHLQTWRTKSGKPGFAFTYTNSFTDLTNIPFTRWTNNDVTVYRFKTNFIALLPDDAGETNKNGYVVLSRDGKELSVYYLWGE